MENIIFDVGQTLSIETYYKTYLATQVLGWEKDAFVLTRAIYVHGQPAELQSNDACKVRFLKDGTAYGFETEVISVQFFPHPLMFIKYPAKVECLMLRVAPRFKIDIPAGFSDASGTLIAEATMLDISEGGCGLKVPLIEGKEISPEAAYTITFKLLDKDLSMTGCVKKLDKCKETCFLGMEFTNMTSQNKETLTRVLDFLKKHTAGTGSNHAA